MDIEKEQQDAASADSWIDRTPWVGIASILSILVCAATSGAILAISHGDVVEDWQIKPAVLLAILSAASNIAFSAALATGVAIRFWLHASRGGLLTQLHYIWDHGRGIGLIRALRAGSEARRVAIIATLGYIVQFSTGPLLQRATYQAAQDHFQHDIMYLDISTKIPDGHFGIIQNKQVVSGRPAMSQQRAWYRNETIPTKLEPGYKCDSGTCLGHVTAAGFTYTCTALPPRRLAMIDKTGTHREPVFAINASRPDRTPLLNLTTLHISSVQEGCIAALQEDHCQFRTAVVSYPIIIQNSTLSLRYPDLLSDMTTINSHPPPSPGDTLSVQNGTPTGPLAGLWYFLNTWLTENATMRFNPEVNKTFYHSDKGGELADIFFRSEPWDYNTTTNPLHQCGLVWDSPTEYVIKAMYDYIFRVALKTGAERKEFLVEKVTSELVFRSDVRHLGAALAATGCCLVLLNALFWGFWRLGKKVTLSPLETARVFGGVTGMLGRERTIEDILKAARGYEFRVDAGDGGNRVRTVGADGYRVHGEVVHIKGKAEEVGEEFRGAGARNMSYRHGQREMGSGGSDTCLSQARREVRWL